MSPYPSRDLLSIVFCALLFLIPYDQVDHNSDTPELLIYCGITMVEPIRMIVDDFEEIHNIKIIISQGGSEELHQNLKTSPKGDLYLPVSDTYRFRHLKDRILGDDLKLGHADIFISWKATAFLKNNRKFNDIIKLNSEIAAPKRLTLNFFKFSKQPQYG